MNSPISDPPHSLKPMAMMAILVLALWCGAAWIAFATKSNQQPLDLFGALNALFSGLAFTGVIFTILLQREELQLQREELRQTRAELARTADAQEKSEFALKAQVKAAHDAQKLAALNHMMDFANECYRRVRTEPINEHERKSVETWIGRRQALVAELDQVYQELFPADSLAVNRVP